MRIQTKIILLITFIIIINTGTSLFVANRLLNRAIEDEYNKQGALIANTISELISRQVINGDVIYARETLKKITETTQGMEYAYVVSFDGRLFAHTFEKGFPMAMFHIAHKMYISRESQIEKYLFGDTPVIDVSFPLIKGMRAHVHIGMNESRLYMYQKVLFKQLLIPSLIIMALGLFLALIIGRRITKPISLFVRKLSSLTGENIEELSIPGNTGVEVFELTQAFNSMISKRKTMEETLRESEVKYRALIETTGTGFVIVDGQGNVLDANPEYVRMTGYNQLDEILGRNVIEWTAEYDRKRNAEAVKKCFETGFVRNLEIDYAGKDGSITPVEINATVIEQEGAPIILTMMRDITERKQATEALASERERLLVTLRSIGDGVITTDTSGNIVLLNKIAEDLTGWSQKEARGRPLGVVFNIINEKTGKPCENPVAKVLASGKIIGLANHTTLIARDGTKRSIADSGAPILDKKSRAIGVVLVFRDMTEKIRMEEELQKIEKLESVGVLAGGIAHDFNNILVGILSNISLATQFIDSDAKAYPLLIEAERASLRAKDLTQQLLTFSKGGEPVKETVSMSKIIKDSADFVLHGGNVVCQYHLPDDLWLVEIDIGQMSQVIQNLIINANHAMPEGGVIHITCENIDSVADEDNLMLQEDNYVKITIRDSGIGIPGNVIDRIFDPYFSTKQEGSGLGLAISHSIISKHSGLVFVQSESGVGTTFTIYLPPASVQRQQKEKEETIEPVKGKFKVMVMDDNEMVRDAAQAMLMHFGCEVVFAKDGTEAIRQYKEYADSPDPVDIIIMDLTVPGGMGGEEAVKEILAINPAAKVIVSSGYSNDPVMANYREYGFSAAVIKPYKLQELTKAINQALL